MQVPGDTRKASLLDGASWKRMWTKARGRSVSERAWVDSIKLTILFIGNLHEQSVWYDSDMPCIRFFPQARRYIYTRGDGAPALLMPRAMQGAE
jgi:hypothetical protein